jgi:hypothetical protein
MEHDQQAETGNLVNVMPGCYLMEMQRKEEPAMVMLRNMTLGLVLNKTSGRNLIQLQTEGFSRIFVSETALIKVAEGI